MVFALLLLMSGASLFCADKTVKLDKAAAVIASQDENLKVQSLVMAYLLDEKRVMQGKLSAAVEKEKTYLDTISQVIRQESAVMKSKSELQLLHDGKERDLREAVKRLDISDTGLAAMKKELENARGEVAYADRLSIENAALKSQATELYKQKKALEASHAESLKSVTRLADEKAASEGENKELRALLEQTLKASQQNQSKGWFSGWLQ